jgi:hypothetical protein
MSTANPLYGYMDVDRRTGRFFVLINEKPEVEGAAATDIRKVVDASTEEEFNDQLWAVYVAEGRRPLVLTDGRTHGLVMVPGDLTERQDDHLPPAVL